MTVAVHQGDCREIIPTLGVTVDAVCTDPPYDLVSMTKRFGKPGSAPATSPDHARFARGFMGQQWDGEGVAFDPETWRVIGSVLRPGGFLVAFGAPRTHHRLAAAIEDAGFVIQDCLMWLFATGFPKRRDMLKPAYEPIVLAYKPGGKRTMQVDECRIPIIDAGGSWGNGRSLGSCWSPGRTNGGSEPEGKRHENGRWPANVCHDGSGEVVALFPHSAGNSNQQLISRGRGTVNVYGDFENRSDSGMGRADNGNAARFFFSAKAGRDDRFGSRHPTVKPVDLMKWLVALVTPPRGVVLDPFAGSGTTGVAAFATNRDCILIEREAQYVADIRERLAFYEGGGGHSAQMKNRNRKVDHGPLFEAAALPADWESQDSAASFNAAIKAIGDDVRSGRAPVPDTGYFARKDRA